MIPAAQGITSPASRPATSITLRPIHSAEFAYFQALVHAHVSPQYPETEQGYASMLAAHTTYPLSERWSTTIRRRIWAVTNGRVTFGFFVASEKNDRSVKIGPVVIDPRFRRQQFAAVAMSELIQLYRRHGWERFYATVPVQNRAAQDLALSTGFETEAILRRHFSCTSDEAVLGWGQTSAISGTGLFRHGPVGRLIGDLSQQINFQHRPVLALTDHAHDVMLAAAPKRGGSARLFIDPARDTSRALSNLRHFEAYLSLKQQRRVYIIIEGLMADLQERFIESGYQVEGLLNATGGTQVLLGKLLGGR